MKLLLTLALLAAAAAPGLAVRCYACDSTSNPSCADPMDQAGVGTLQCGVSDVGKSWSKLFPGLVDSLPRVTSFNSACIKSVSTTGSGRSVTFRGCSFGDNMCAAIKHSLESTGGHVQYCDACQGELCNAAPRAARDAVLLIAACLLAAKLAF